MASEKNWHSVRRGKNEHKAQNVMISEALIQTMRTENRSFDPAQKCVQFLKGEQNIVEVASESCGNNGVIGEERNDVLRFKVGKLIPAAVLTAKPSEKPAEKLTEKPKTEICESSRYELTQIVAVGKDKSPALPMEGELIVNRSTTMIAEPAKQGQKVEQRQGKSAEKPAMIESHAYKFTLNRMAEQKPVILEQKPEQKPVVLGQKPEQKPVVLGQKPEQKPVVLGQKPEQKPVVLGQKPEQKPEQKPTEQPKKP